MVSLLMGIMIIIAMIEMEIIVSEDNAIISGFPGIYQFVERVSS